LALLLRLWLGVAVCVAVFAGWSEPAEASQPLADLNVTDVSLRVNTRDEALVTYTTAKGLTRHVLAWGALDAVDPDPSVPQQQFKFDYAGGWGKYRRPAWKTFVDRCSPYDGPALVYLVAACKAPDGSYWALQSWQRVLPLRGVDPFRPDQGAFELHLSHWTKPLAVLEVSPNWTYGGTFQGLFGRLLFDGKPVYGFKTPSARQDDPNARYFYIDTFNSAYGPGWKRDGAKVTHERDGGFCYSFAPLPRPPAGYANIPNVPGTGERYRVTVMGPGVTPDLQWEGDGLGRFDPAADQKYNELFDTILAGDDACASER
jgi:hypothetical protein